MKAKRILRELHWTGIVFGSGTGLIASYVLFAVSGSFGAAITAQLVIQLIGFIVAGYVAGKFSLIHEKTAGRLSGLILFLIIATSTIAAGADPNLFSLILLGALAVSGGSYGAMFSANKIMREQESPNLD